MLVIFHDIFLMILILISKNEISLHSDVPQAKSKKEWIAVYPLFSCKNRQPDKPALG